MRTDYAQAISERAPALAQRERALRTHAALARVQMLRLLKEGIATSLPMCAKMVGYSPRQVARWWARYKAQGLDALVTDAPRPGKPSQLTAEAYAGLCTQMRAGKIVTLADAQAYLAAEWGIAYRSVGGVWWQLRRHKAKPKTGRRQHRQTDPAQQAAFKKGGSISA